MAGGASAETQAQEAERREDPMLDNREVTYQEMRRGLADQQLSEEQLLTHWNNLKPAQAARSPKTMGEDEQLARAMEMSLQGVARSPTEEQIALATAISLQEAAGSPKTMAEDPQLQGVARSPTEEQIALATAISLQEAARSPKSMAEDPQPALATETSLQEAARPPKATTLGVEPKSTEILKQKRLGTLKRMASGMGCTEDEVQAVDNNDNPKDEVIQLIVRKTEELKGLTLGQLKKKARDMGFGKDTIDAADNHEDPKVGVIQLISGEQAAGSPKTMGEDEQLDRAIAMSLQGVARSPTDEQIDLAKAISLQEAARSPKAEAADIFANDTVKWMWGDASIVGHKLAQQDPLGWRWSHWRWIGATIHDLEQRDRQRPVEIMIARTMANLPFDTVDQALLALRQAKAMPAEVVQAKAMPAEVVQVSAPSPGLQVELIRDMLSQHQEFKAGDDWYVLSMRWWDLWKGYVQFDGDVPYDGLRRVQTAEAKKTPAPSVGVTRALSFPLTQATRERRACSGRTKGDKPPKIDNSDLTVSPDSERLKCDLLQDRDFIFVPQEAWIHLFRWYGGGPALTRRVNKDPDQPMVELYKLMISVYKVDSCGMPKLDTRTDLYEYRSENVQVVLKSLALKEGLTQAESADDLDDLIRLWYRPDLAVQADTQALEAVEGWQQLKPEISTSEATTLGDLGVRDNAVLLMEVAEKKSAIPGDNETKWPFWHRMRTLFKGTIYKDPRKEILEVGDKCDADVELVENSQKRSVWVPATVKEKQEDSLLIQLHDDRNNNWKRPEPKQFSSGELIEDASPLDDGSKPTEAGGLYEAKGADGKYVPVRIVGLHPSGDRCIVQVENRFDKSGRKEMWEDVSYASMRHRSKPTELCKEGLKKVFDKYADKDGEFRRDRLTSFLQSGIISEELFRKPYGVNNEYVPYEGFVEYWRARLGGGNGVYDIIQLFKRVSFVKYHSEEEELIASKGQVWIPQKSDRLAQYQSMCIPSSVLKRVPTDPQTSIRDYREGDMIDVKLNGCWMQGQVKNLNWQELTIKVETMNPYPKYREWIPMESNRLARFETETPRVLVIQPPITRSMTFDSRRHKVGSCGLENMGNTCFMNASLQALSNTDALRFFFVGGPDETPAFEREFVRSSPWEGNLAKAFGQLLRNMWSNEKYTERPEELKRQIVKKRQEFEGYRQHDACDLLEALLDGLHEDLDRTKYLPERQVCPTPGRVLTMNENQNQIIATERTNGQQVNRTRQTGDEAADKEWEAWNTSKIHELFGFQMRQEMQCLTCKHTRVSFNAPEMYLSLPVPRKQITVVPLDFPRSPMSTMFIDDIPTTENFEALEAAIRKKMGPVPAERSSCFYFADVVMFASGGCISSHFPKTSPLSDIQAHHKVWAIEVQLVQGSDENLHTFVPVQFREVKKGTWLRSDDYDYCAPPRVLGVTSTTTNAEVHSRLKEIATSMLNLKQLPDPVRVFGPDSDRRRDKGEALAENDNVFNVPERTSLSFDAKDISSNLPASEEGITIWKCMDKYTECEEVEVNCDHCKRENQPHHKRLSLWTLPEVLIVHFKRFDNYQHKITDPIQFPEELDLKRYLHREGANMKFDLYGVVNHLNRDASKGTSCGHYTAHAIIADHPQDRGEKKASGAWWNFDDGHVQRLQEGVGVLRNEEAYMLFYRRRSG